MLGKKIIYRLLQDMKVKIKSLKTPLNSQVF